MNPVDLMSTSPTWIQMAIIVALAMIITVGILRAMHPANRGRFTALRMIVLHGRSVPRESTADGM